MGHLIEILRITADILQATALRNSREISGMRVAYVILDLPAVVCIPSPGILHASLAPIKISRDQRVTGQAPTACRALRYIATEPATGLVARPAQGSSCSGSPDPQDFMVRQLGDRPD